MNKRLARDYVGYILSWLAMSITVCICLGIFIYLFVNGISQLSPDFIFKQPVPTSNERLSGGISTPIIGSLLLTFIGIIIAFPWSLATAIFLNEYASKNKLAGILRMGIDVLSGVPTIVIAIFGLAIFTNPQFAFLSEMVPGSDKALGRSFLVAGVTMAVMVLPFMIKTCEEALKTVSNTYREASLALGASKVQTIFKVVLPASKDGLITAITLGIGRIIGDTAIVWLTLGDTLKIGNGSAPWWMPNNILNTLKGTGSTLTSFIFYASPAGEGNQTSKAFGAALVLIIIIILINLLTDFIGGFKKRVSE
ncbi:MAG: phosphate ABC transporter permease PstA [Bacillota bacterium]|nr:phosphate ABC transporter permease PstA [Bacillota bacterium]